MGGPCGRTGAGRKGHGRRSLRSEWHGLDIFEVGPAHHQQSAVAAKQARVAYQPVRSVVRCAIASVSACVGFGLYVHHAFMATQMARMLHASVRRRTIDRAQALRTIRRGARGRRGWPEALRSHSMSSSANITRTFEILHNPQVPSDARTLRTSTRRTYVGGELSRRVLRYVRTARGD